MNKNVSACTSVGCLLVNFLRHYTGDPDDLTELGSRLRSEIRVSGSFMEDS